jgi:DNA-binding response OmpR family regulator
MKSSNVKIPKILVVEDEPSIRHLCLEILTGEGFEVDIAANGM